MKIGVRFCGGCNPRYDRGRAFETIRAARAAEADFEIAREGRSYDRLLVIGGCPSCCASYEQFSARSGAVKMWDESHIERVVEELAVHSSG